ncbi:MAG TPA: hypothetical protein VLE73_04290 [Candidatus Saccharimonadales bacterium]|nr:hypothetical protein [Candidatus Saccharimonadales bacterium]
MGFLDDLKSDMSDESRERYEELKHREAAGDLDDQARAELNQLRERFEYSESS